MWVHAGVWLRALPVKSIDHVVASLVAEPTEEDPEFSPPLLNKKTARLVRHAPPLGLFVYAAELGIALMLPSCLSAARIRTRRGHVTNSRCCHGNRDIRCGVIGEKLVLRLEALIREREWEENVKIFRCSHVGGHKVTTAHLGHPGTFS